MTSTSITNHPAAPMAPTAREYPASLSAHMHITRDQVRVMTLPAGMVSLELGDRNANVGVIGDLDTITAVLEAAIADARRIADERKAAER